MSMTTDLIFKPGDIPLKEAYLGKLLRQCEEQKPVFNVELAGWLQELRQKSAYYVVKSHLPTKKDEEWRFTDLSSLLANEFTIASEAKVLLADIQPFIYPEIVQSRLVFVNGIYAPQLSDVSAIPEGIYVGNLEHLDLIRSQKLVRYLGQQEGSTEVFTALNTSGMKDAAIIWGNPNVKVKTPIQLLFLSIPSNDQPTIDQPRTLIVAETGSSFEVIEKYGAMTSGCSDRPQNHPYFTNTVTEIFLENNAQVKHYRVQRESGDGFHIGKTAVSQARDSRYYNVEINLGAKLFRHNFEIQQQGEQTETILNGLTILGGRQVGDTHSIINLNHPHGTTNQLHKYIIDEFAQGVFSGKVFVPQNAQLTNASQLNRNLLLSSKARIQTKPELQITADNVKCSHGATVSQLEDDEIFYLRSRGLNEYDARHLLIDAFAGEILDLLPIESLNHRLTQCVACRTLD
jgi:Fe-S cluster assembly protein SufD